MAETTNIKNKLRRLKRKLIRPPRPRALILVYHHIGTRHFDPWDLCVSEARFEEHLGVLAEGYEVLPLARLNKALLKKNDTRKKIFITFDDGYLDNYESAVPLLKDRGLPATFFIPTRIIHGTKPFWWELLDHIFGSKMDLPGRFHLYGGKDNFVRDLSDEIRRPAPAVENRWSANTAEPPTARCRFYLELCEWIKRLAADEQEKVAGQLTEQFQLAEIPDAGCRKMSPGQIRLLSGQDFETGAHTVRHPALSFQSPEVQQQEIINSKIQLENLTGKRVAAFAYPHGEHDQQTKMFVQEAGFSAACTTEGKGIHPGTDLLALPRIWINDYGASGLKQRLNWFFNT